MSRYENEVTHIIGGKNQTNAKGKTEIERAREIAKTLGMFIAARYLAKRNWSLDAACFILLGV